MTERILQGYISRCICCNRILSGTECTRTYPNTKELVATCNSCLNAAKDDREDTSHINPAQSEGTTPSKYIDSHSRYFYEYFDN